MIISGFLATNPTRLATEDANTSPPEPVTAQALVALDRPAWRSVSRTVRPDASFVTHLIATAMQIPQTQSLRRLDPSAAGEAYARRPPSPVTGRGTASGKIVSQTV